MEKAESRRAHPRHPVTGHAFCRMIFRIGGVSRAYRLSEGEAAARGGDGAAELFGGCEPFLDDDFYVGESFLVGLSVGGTAGKFRDFGDEGFVGLTPVDDDL